MRQTAHEAHIFIRILIVLMRNVNIYATIL